MMPELTVGALRHLLKILDDADNEPWVHHSAQKGAGADQWITSGEDGVTVCEVLNHAYYCKPEYQRLRENVGTYEQIDRKMRAIAEGHNALRPLLVALCEAWLDDWLYAEGSKGWDCRQHTRGVLNQGVLTQDGYWLEQRGWEKSE